jgi:hypothetical protein
MKIWHTKQEYYIVNSAPIAQNVAFSPVLDLGTPFRVSGNGPDDVLGRKPCRWVGIRAAFAPSSQRSKTWPGSAGNYWGAISIRRRQHARLQFVA